MAEAALKSAEAAIRAAQAAELHAEAAVRSAKSAKWEAVTALAGAIVSVGAVVVGLEAINSGKETALSAVEAEGVRLYETQRIASLASLAKGSSLYRTEVRRGRDRLVAGSIDFRQFDDMRQERYAEWDAALAVARLQDDGNCEDEFLTLQSAVNAMNRQALRLASREARSGEQSEADIWTGLGLGVLVGSNGVVRSCRRSGN